MTEPDLLRFVTAQDAVYPQVTEELTSGSKQSHWIWFVFPQLAGLGRSAMAERYAIGDLNQARRYLADPILGARLRQGVQLKGKSAVEILGSPDDLKFRSCLTLFREARPPSSRIASCSPKHWSSFIAENQTPGRWSC